MTKSDAIKQFGSGAEMARALGLTRGRISQLPDVLPAPIEQRVIGVLVMTGRVLPGQVEHLTSACPRQDAA